ncbi:MAG: hypothetical protein ABW005_09615 [Burkholderiaceae bacterium]
MAASPGALLAVRPAASFGRQALQILWPAFVMAGVLEMLVFAVVDPGELHGFGSAPIDWPAAAVYTVSFFIFWGVVAVAGAITALLAEPAPPA